MDEDSSEGRLARAAPLLPVAVGALALAGERADVVSAPVAIVATAIAAAVGLWVVSTSAMAALSIAERERLELAERLEELSDRDPLTGVLNSGRLDEELDRQLAFGERHGTQTAVLAIELDEFEAIRESHGGATCDELVIATAEVLGDELRTTDIVTRRPPDGFVVLIPQTDEHAARVVAGKLVRRLRSIERGRSDGASISLRASIGIALSAPGSLEAGERLLRRADEALAAARAAGGDRLALPGAPVGEPR